MREVDVVPISDLFYRDAGPHIVERGAAPPAPRSAMTDSLDAGIAAISGLDSSPLAAPVALPQFDVVSITTLLYRGPRALARARELRDEIRASGQGPSQPAIDELFDLLDLAVAE